MEDLRLHVFQYNDSETQRRYNAVYGYYILTRPSGRNLLFQITILGHVKRMLHSRSHVIVGITTCDCLHDVLSYARFFKSVTRLSVLVISATLSPINNNNINSS